MAFEIQEKWNESHFELMEFDSISKVLKENIKKYKELVVTEDQIAVAKKDRASLNNKKKAITQLKTKVIKDATSLFKQQCEDLVAIIDEGVANIDAQIKTYEESFKQAKKDEIKRLYASKDSVFFDLEKIWNPKWLNATYTMSLIEKEIDVAIETYINNLDTLKTICETDYEWSLALKVLRETLDLTKAIAELTRVRDLANAIKEEKTPIKEDDDEPKFKVTFECNITRLQAQKLSEFLRENHIDFKQL